MPEQPVRFSSEQELDGALSRTRAATTTALSRLSGDLVILGAGGKMGPTFARMAKAACDEAGMRHRKVIGISRFSSDAVRTSLESYGITTIACDLSDSRAVEQLPDAGAMLFLSGKKFGTTGEPGDTWIQNVVVPQIAAERYRGVPTVALSTGNVYPLVPVDGPGASENTEPDPIGEYAVTCLGRERVLTHRSVCDSTPMTIVRLNYAVEPRYGVLTDVAQKITSGRAIDLAMGHVNIIWQRDACAAILEMFAHVAVPPLIVNVSGVERLSVRSLAERLGQALGREPKFTGSESPDALLSDVTLMTRLVGAPETGVDTMIDTVSHWVSDGHALRAKPTNFETRDGSF